MNPLDYVTLTKDHEIFSIDFKSLDNMYSLQEYYAISNKMLVDFYIYNSFHQALNTYAQGLSCNSSSPNYSKYFKVNSISMWIYQHNRSFYKILYETPLCLVPLELFRDDVISVVAAWRLEIGK